MFGIDEGALTAELLHFGDGLQGERGLARGFRAVDLDHATPRQTADAQRNVQAQRAGGDHLDVFQRLAFAQAHDRALAELLFDLGQRGLQGLGLFTVGDRDACALDDCVHVEISLNINGLCRDSSICF
ncbi:hypothetical protein D9M69_533280 [compost metagenome]